MKTKTIHTGAFCIGLDEAILKKNCFESLFSVRSRSLLGNIQGTDSASYLSGILIGSELIGNFSSLNTSKNIAFIGNKNLLNLYETALNHYRICAKIDFLKSEDVLVNAYTNFSHE